MIINKLLDKKLNKRSIKIVKEKPKKEGDFIKNSPGIFMKDPEHMILKIYYRLLKLLLDMRLEDIILMKKQFQFKQKKNLLLLILHIWGDPLE